MSRIADLRKLSARLRRTGSEVLNAPGEHVPARLRRLMRLVDDEPLLKGVVDAGSPPDEDTLELLEACREAGTRLAIPESELEHVGLLHEMLTQLCDQSQIDEATSDGRFRRLCFNYGGEMNFKECVREVLDDTVRPYVGYLERAVSNDLIDATEAAGQPRAVSLSIQGSPNTMVNVAGDSSTIQAHQQQEIEKGASEVLGLAHELIRALAEDRSLPTDMEEELRELAGEVVCEVERDDPNDGKLVRLNNRLRTYVETVEEAKDLALTIRALVIALAKFAAVVAVGDQLPA